MKTENVLAKIDGFIDSLDKAVQNENAIAMSLERKCDQIEDKSRGIMKRVEDLHQAIDSAFNEYWAGRRAKVSVIYGQIKESDERAERAKRVHAKLKELAE